MSLPMFLIRFLMIFFPTSKIHIITGKRRTRGFHVLGTGYRKVCDKSKGAKRL